MTVDVILDAATFRRFTLFDLLRRRKVWRSPAIFAGILSACACVCFVMHHVEGAVMLGCSLLLVGLGMPLVYFGTFFHSLKKQVAASGLQRPKQVYRLHLTRDPEGIAVENATEQATYTWAQVHHAYRDQGATYLFITPQRAFLLPDDCVPEGSEELWKLLCDMLPKEKCTVL